VAHTLKSHFSTCCECAVNAPGFRFPAADVRVNTRELPGQPPASVEIRSMEGGDIEVTTESGELGITEARHGGAEWQKKVEDMRN